MKILPLEIERSTDRAVHAWERSCPEQLFADISLTALKEVRQRLLDAKARLAAADAERETARKERNAVYREAMHVVKCLVNSVKGHPKFGEDCAFYSALGYVSKSERSSGLTRRRAVEPAETREEEEVS